MSTSTPRRESLLSTLRKLLCRLLCGDSPPPPKPQQKSFEPGQVLIIAEYPPDQELSPREIVTRIQDHVSKTELKQPERLILTPARVRVLRGPLRTIAAVVGDVPAARRDPRRLVQYIDGLHSAIKLPPLVASRPDRPQEPKGEPRSQGAADHPASAGLRAETSLAAAAPVTEFKLRAASPNWYASGAKDLIGGGPGAWPASVAAVASSQNGPQPWEFTIDLALPPSATAVEVAILDTVPSYEDLRYACTRWVSDQDAVPPDPRETLNPLLKSLLADPSSGAFNVLNQSASPETVGPAEQLDVVYLPNLVPALLGEHPYLMASHGLFIAGIIRSIAPQAKLRLIQVLNDEGVGSLDSLIGGIACANPRGRDLPLVISCSFMLNVPRSGDPFLPDDLTDVPQTTIDSLTQLMSDVFAQTNDSLDLVIAAAVGNAGTGVTHPAARYPAALPLVAGVAALDQDDQNPATPPRLADYSNNSDDLLSEAFAVFGGETSGGTPPVADASKGMLGVFIERLPTPAPAPVDVVLEPNTNGWARWAGSSFATPIISALMARMIGGGVPAQDTIAVLDAAISDVGVQNALTVRQGQ